MKKEITVIGAGPVGCVLSIYLAKAGYKVTIFEKRSPPNKQTKQGRSINITLCTRGFKMLDEIGIGDLIRAHCVPVYGRVIHHENLELSYQPYGKNGEALYAISRNNLNRLLIEYCLQHEDINFYFDHQILNLDLSSNEIIIQNTISGTIKTAKKALIIGADGAFSVVRMAMQKLKRFNYSQKYMHSGYQEFRIPLRKDQYLEKNAIHLWPREQLFLIGFPNLEDSFTLALISPYKTTNLSSAPSRLCQEELRQLFKQYFSDVMPLVDSRFHLFENSKKEPMVTINCYPWHFENKTVLIGDACHAIYPSYGQGTNASFEDCKILAGCIQENEKDLEEAFQQYTLIRKPNTDVIADLSEEHFSVLSKNNKTAELTKQIEAKVKVLAPQFKSLYHNVSFTTMPYQEALRKENMFKKIIENLLAIKDIDKKILLPEIDQLILKHIGSSFKENVSIMSP